MENKKIFTPQTIISPNKNDITTATIHINTTTGKVQMTMDKPMDIVYFATLLMELATTQLKNMLEQRLKDIEEKMRIANKVVPGA